MLSVRGRTRKKTFQMIGGRICLRTLVRTGGLPTAARGLEENADFPFQFLFVYKRQYQSESGEVMK